MSGWQDSEYREYIAALFKSSPDCTAKTAAVAGAMGISPFTLYDIYKGRIDLTPDRIPALYNASGDVRVVSWIVDRCNGLLLIRTDATPGNIREELDRLVISLGRVTEAHHTAMSDGRITEPERRDIAKQAQELQNAAFALMEAANNGSDGHERRKI